MRTPPAGDPPAAVPPAHGPTGTAAMRMHPSFANVLERAMVAFTFPAWAWIATGEVTMPAERLPRLALSPLVVALLAFAEWSRRAGVLLAGRIVCAALDLAEHGSVPDEGALLVAFGAGQRHIVIEQRLAELRRPPSPLFPAHAWPVHPAVERMVRAGVLVDVLDARALSNAASPSVPAFVEMLGAAADLFEPWEAEGVAERAIAIQVCGRFARLARDHVRLSFDRPAWGISHLVSLALEVLERAPEELREKARALGVAVLRSHHRAQRFMRREQRWSRDRGQRWAYFYARGFAGERARAQARFPEIPGEGFRLAAEQLTTENRARALDIAHLARWLAPGGPVPCEALDRALAERARDIATRALWKASRPRGCDAREIARVLGMPTVFRRAMTPARAGWVVYDRSDDQREQDRSVCRAIAHVLVAREGRPFALVEIETVAGILLAHCTVLPS